MAFFLHLSSTWHLYPALQKPFSFHCSVKKLPLTLNDSRSTDGDFKVPEAVTLQSKLPQRENAT